tara:strand:+ start:223 stop:1350 length:1128 start_codon:yes stop_codon:yes gene_type:complete
MRYLLILFTLFLFSCSPSEEQIAELNVNWNKIRSNIQSILDKTYLFESSNLDNINVNKIFTLDIYLDEKSIYNPKDSKKLFSDISNLFEISLDTLQGIQYKNLKKSSIQFLINDTEVYTLKNNIINNNYDVKAKQIRIKIFIDKEREKLSTVFNIPMIFKMDIDEMTEKYGKPTSHFKATNEQKKLGSTNTIEFYNDSTGIAIDYIEEGLLFKKTKVSSVWLSDDRKWLNIEDYMKIANINSKNNYSIREQKDNTNSNILIGLEINKKTKSNNQTKSNKKNTSTNTYGLSQGQYDAIMDLTKNGYLSINASLNRAEISKLIWGNLTYSQKRDFSAGLATYCGTKKGSGLNWVTIHDLHSGKKIAKYSKSYGFTTY